MLKQVFRKKLQARRMRLTEDERRILSSSVQSALVESSFFTEADCLALYSPTRGEVATESLFFIARQTKKKICFPRVEGGRMVFVEVNDLMSLRKGAFGVLEPSGESIIPVAALDLMVIPGLAFDRYGNRLGYGKGFYDRELHSVGFSGVLIGLCYRFQLVDRLPVEAHDVPVDHLVTEQGLFSPLCYKGTSGSP